MDNLILNLDLFSVYFMDPYPVLLVTFMAFTRDLWYVFREISPGKMANEQTLRQSTPTSSI